MKMIIPMSIIGGMAVAGVLYFMKNPQKFKQIKEMEVDAMNQMNKIIEDNK